MYWAALAFALGAASATAWRLSARHTERKTYAHVHKQIVEFGADWAMRAWVEWFRIDLVDMTVTSVQENHAWTLQLYVRRQSDADLASYERDDVWYKRHDESDEWTPVVTTQQEAIDVVLRQKQLVDQILFLPEASPATQRFNAAIWAARVANTMERFPWNFKEMYSWRASDRDKWLPENRHSWRVGNPSASIDDRST